MVVVQIKNRIFKELKAYDNLIFEALVKTWICNFVEQYFCIKRGSV